MKFKRGKRIEPRARDWVTGKGFTNGLTSSDISYLDSVVMAALSGGYAAGLDAAREAVAALDYPHIGSSVVVEVKVALAVIEALREKP